MSGDTASALTAAANAFVRALPAGGADLAPLHAAANAHLEAARPHETVLAEYSAALDAKNAGQPYDPAEFAALAGELGMLRMAVATVHGHPPGLPHVVSTGPG